MKFAHLKSVVEIDSFENIISLVENGKGIALLPKWLNKRAKIKPYDQDIVLIPFISMKRRTKAGSSFRRNVNARVENHLTNLVNTLIISVHIIKGIL